MCTSSSCYQNWDWQAPNAPWCCLPHPGRCVAPFSSPFRKLCEFSWDSGSFPGSDDITTLHNFPWNNGELCGESLLLVLSTKCELQRSAFARLIAETFNICNDLVDQILEFGAGRSCIRHCCRTLTVNKRCCREP